MAYTVFFREGSKIFQADSYIQGEPECFHTALKALTQSLSLNGFLEGHRITKLVNGDWSVWLEDATEGLTNYSLFISSFENRDIPVSEPAVVSKKRELVIISPAGEKESVGGFHPGYWSISQCADFFEPLQRKYFMEAVAEILAGIPSENYTVHTDNSISIHIYKPESAYSINIQCTAKWV
jgi:hypothetical protein